jgi:hypothetical protein
LLQGAACGGDDLGEHRLPTRRHLRLDPLQLVDLAGDLLELRQARSAEVASLKPLIVLVNAAEMSVASWDT